MRLSLKQVLLTACIFSAILSQEVKSGPRITEANGLESSRSSNTGQLLDLQINSAPGWVDIIIKNTGSTTTLSQSRDAAAWKASLITSQPSQIRLGSQRLSERTMGFKEILFEGSGTSFFLTVLPETGVAIGSPVVSNNGNDMMIRFQRPAKQTNSTSASSNSSLPGSLPVAPFVPALSPRATAPPVGDFSVGTIPIPQPRVSMPGLGPIKDLMFKGDPVSIIRALLSGSKYSLAAVISPNCARSTAKESGGSSSSNSSASAELYECPIPINFLKLSNTTAEEALNTVLQMSAMQGYLRGNTLIVGRSLPQSIRPLLTKAIRLNQVTPNRAAAFLMAQGASVSSMAIKEEESESTDFKAISAQTDGGGGSGGGGSGGGGSGGNSSGGNSSGSVSLTSEKTRVQRDEGNEAVVEVSMNGAIDDFPDPFSTLPSPSAFVLRGLSVTPEYRSKTLFLTGDTQQLALAEDFIRRIDIRRRQASVSIRILDIDLTNSTTINNSFSYKTDTTYVVSDSGNAILNFGGLQPATTPQQQAPTLPNPQYPNNRFYDEVEARVSSASSKLIASPTLIVQEGQASAVATGRTYVTSVNCQTGSSSTNGSGGQPACNPIITTVGLTLNLEVLTIDDNGFITLVVDPKLTAPVGATTFNGGTGPNTIVDLAVRQLASGKVRVRDGQTLILTGIIDDLDRAEATKWPMLGDIPFIGQFFRGSTNARRKSELVITLTPRIVDDRQGGAFGYGYSPTSVEAKRAVYQ